MIALGITYIDPIVVVLVIVSAIYAATRGFVSETLSIVAWAAAAFATLFFGPKLAPLARNLISPPFLGQLAGYALIFLVVLIPLSFISHRLSESVKSSQVSTLDRSLGAAFGVIRGVAIIGLAYIAFSALVPVRSQPEWLAAARTLPVIQGSAEVLLSLVPDQHVSTLAEKKPASPRVKAAVPPVPGPRPARANAAKKRAQKAYGAEERRELDRLIETTGGSGNP
jgi:membrane protein required for colicin V production